MQVAEGKAIKLTIPSLKAHFHGTVGQYKADGITETLLIKKFENSFELQEYINSNINVFMSDGNSSLIAILYSVMLSRGLNKIKGEILMNYRCLLTNRFSQQYYWFSHNNEKQ